MFREQYFELLFDGYKITEYIYNAGSEDEKSYSLNGTMIDLYEIVKEEKSKETESFIPSYR